MEKMPLDPIIQLPEPIMDNIVAEHILKTLDGRVLTSEDTSFSFKPGTGLWCRNTKPAQTLQDAIFGGVIVERKKEIPYKRACKGHRVHDGYTVLSLNQIPGGKLTN